MPSDISRPRVGRRADVRLSGHMLKSPAGKVKMGKQCLGLWLPFICCCIGGCTNKCHTQKRMSNLKKKKGQKTLSCTLG